MLTRQNIIATLMYVPHSPYSLIFQNMLTFNPHKTIAWAFALIQIAIEVLGVIIGLLVKYKSCCTHSHATSSADPEASPLLSRTERRSQLDSMGEDVFSKLSDSMPDERKQEQQT
jgi:hypothetical protein